QRNRIVAGMADAVVVVESAQKGGSLITAEFANGYNRDVFAFPGRINDTYSAGCNKLIRENRAALITSAEDFVQMLGWATDIERRQKLADGIQQELFPTLSSDEQRIIDCLQPTDGTEINILALRTKLPISQLSSLLFSLEMKGMVKKMGGNSYRRG
ncbi:MAG: DNA-protecting protein DprA, partial [Bacteroidaceae bacterium]|nr:DNA-protecting protein DprA [Bacteroidaceae bacterium]